MNAKRFPSNLANRTTWILLGLSLILSRPAAGAAPLSLAGSWRFALDSEDVGIAEHWAVTTLPERIRLPGALQNQGFGNDIRIDTPWTGDVNKDVWLKEERYAPYREPGHIRIPWALQPEKHYVGAAWYQREFKLPKDWQGSRLLLTLERPHWETRVWVDGLLVGTDRSLSTPHVYDLGRHLQPGSHTLTIRVDNRVHIKVGDWAHSVTDHTQGNWNGIAGRIEIRPVPLLSIDDLRVYPRVATRSILIRGRITNASGLAGAGAVDLTVEPWIGERARPARGAIRTQSLPVTWDAQGGVFDVELDLGAEALLWDEFEPGLYRLTARLGEMADPHEVVFGLREVGVKEGLVTINGRPTYLRGTLECAIFPLTGYPPTDVKAWKKIIRACQAHGLNHIRFHSWCPPEAAFQAADELGFYFHVECAAWTSVGDGEPIDDWLYAESERIVQSYGNHPSLIMMAYGNEPHGKNHAAWLAQWVSYWKDKDPRRLYTTAAGWPALEGNDYHVIHAPRGPKGWGGRSYSNEVRAFNVPVVVHEMGQWCVFPNFSEIRKYKGPLKPYNLEIARDFLRNHGMLDQWRDFLRASGRLQVLCYKEEIEAAYRTPGIGGVQLLDLHDFPGQGTALVGILDPFWEEKGYVTPDEFRRFYNTTVPLARMEKRVWTRDERFRANLELAHFGPAPIPDGVVAWRITSAKGASMVEGRTNPRTLPLGRSTDLGQIDADLSQWAAPAAYKLSVEVTGTTFQNEWNVWVYPESGTSDGLDSHEILVVKELSEEALSRLREGGRVLVTGTKLGPAHPPTSFQPIFWNRFMFASQRTQTLGLLCDPDHPALRGFPTSFHTDWQWEPILARSKAAVLDSLPEKLRPIVQVIDDWNTSRRLGLIFECRVGEGRLLVCMPDLTGDLSQSPVGRQLRRSLLDYMDSEAFAPKVTVPESHMVELLQFMSPSQLVRLDAKVIAASSEDTQNGHLASHAIDGDPDTFWHTRWQPAEDPMPHELVIDLGKPVRLAGIRALPRQDMTNGRIKDFVIYARTTPPAEDWGDPVLRGTMSDGADLREIPFPSVLEARYLKLVVASEVKGHPFAALAELDVTLAP